MGTSANTHKLLTCILIISILICLMGLLGILGWHLENRVLIQIHSDFVPMQYNTALAFLLAGTGLFALIKKRQGWSLLFGLMLCTISGLTLVQYLFQINLGIDQLLIEHYFFRNPPHPARMAPSTALGFLLLGIIYSLEYRLIPEHRAQYQYWGAGSILIILGLLSLSSYIFDIPYGYGRSNWTGMALHTSMGFIMLGAALIAYSYHRKPETIERNKLLFGAIIIVTSMLAILNWQIANHWEYQRIQQLLETETALIAKGLDNTLNNNIETLKRLAYRYKMHNDPERLWETDVPAYFENNPAIKRLAFVGPELNIKHTLSTWDSERDGPQNPETNLNAINEQTYAKPIEFTPHGRAYLTIVIPLTPGNRQTNLLLADLDLQLLLNSLVRRALTKDARLSLSHVNHSAPRKDQPDSPGDHWQSEQPFSIQNHQWKLTTQTTSAAIADLSGNLPTTNLAFSIALLAIIGWMMHCCTTTEHLQRHLKNLVQSTPSGLIEADCDGKILAANPAATQIFGYSEKELTSMKVEELIPEDLRARHIDHRDNFLKNPTSRRMGGGRDLLVLNKRGEQIPVEIGISPILTEPGMPLLCTVVDISERKRAEETIQQNSKHLEMVNQELAQFAYAASHDLKSPLRAIENLASWIEEDAGNQLPENSKRDLQLLKQRVYRMENLLNGLLEYSKIGRIQHKYENVDCNAVVSDTRELLNIPQGFEVSIEGSLPIITAPAAAIELVFRNIIGNAIKHHDKNEGKIVISATRTKDFYELHFQDDGPGILPQFHQQAFRIFQTLKPRDETEGSGLGLSMVKKTLENYGGEITIESDPSFGKRGSKFIVRWPINIRQISQNSRTS